MLLNTFNKGCIISIIATIVSMHIKQNKEKNIVGEILAVDGEHGNAPCSVPTAQSLSVGHTYLMMCLYLISDEVIKMTIVWSVSPLASIMAVNLLSTSRLPLALLGRGLNKVDWSGLVITMVVNLPSAQLDHRHFQSAACTKAIKLHVAVVVSLA